MLTALSLSSHALEINPDVRTGIYPAAQPVVFHVTLGEDDERQVVEKRTIVQAGCMGPPLEVKRATTETGFTLTLAKAEPGWYVCQTLKQDPGKIKFSALRVTCHPKNAVASVGVMVDPSAVGPAKPAPDDFAVFWAEKKKALAELEPKTTVTPVVEEQVKALNSWQEREWGKGVEAGIEFFNFDIEVLPGQRSAKGFYAIPAKARPTSCPAIVTFQAAGLSAPWNRGDLATLSKQAQTYNAMAFDVSSNGIMLGRPAAYFEEQGADPELILGMALRMLRVFDFIADRPEWNGKLICRGRSRGGGQALTGGGLDKRVTAVIAMLPGQCDSGGPAIGRPNGHLMWNFKNMHFDNIYLSRNNAAETLLFAGLTDTTCPPTGIVAAFNAIPHARKKAILYPHMPHGLKAPADMWLGDPFELEKTFIQRHLGHEQAETAARQGDKGE
jgi:hypothetical protein